jgi:predicted nucleic acid-binding protein
MMQPPNPLAQTAERALTALKRDGETLHISPQNLYEFWAVATRLPSENGLGLTIEQAGKEMARLKQLFMLLPELPLFAEWERIVATHHVSGKNSHDARLVAAMIVNGIRNILTFNVQDFTRYRGISVLDPQLLM